MRATNSAESYGWVSRALHWTMALGLVGMLGLGTWIADMQVSLSNLWLFSLHKSLGIALLALALLRLAWARLSPPPALLAGGTARWQLGLARAVHAVFYVLFLAIPLTGWAASGAGGLDIVVFGGVVLPPIAPVSEAWEAGLFALHAALTKLLLAALALHVAGALWRQLVKRDGTLRRML